MTRNTTKRALVMSMISLILCVSMLAGSTFAWFTDTASTGVNKITSGNLDMVVSWYNGSEWSEIDSNTKLFKEGTEWEPGYTEVAYIKVENAGSLAFKYNLSINVFEEIAGKSVTEKDIYLSNILKFDAVEIQENGFYATREDAAKAVEATAETFATKIISDKLENTGDVKYYAMVVYMPEEIGNDANHDGFNIPSISFGVRADATQLTKENDSFDDQYDKNAFVPESLVGNVAQGNDTVLKGKNITLIIPAESILTNEDGNTLNAGDKLTVSIEPTVLNENITLNIGEKAETYEITLTDENGKKVASSEDITVEINIGAGRTGSVAVYHNEERISGVSYNGTIGTVTFVTKDFSPFTIVGKVVLSGGNGTVTEGGTDDEKDIRATLDLGGVVDFGGAVLYSDNSDANWGACLREYTFKDGTIVRNLTVTGVNSAARWWHADGDVVFENCSFEPKGTYAMHFDSGNGTITFRNCTFSGWSTFGSDYSKITFEGCTFKKGNSSYNAVATRCETVYNNCVFEDNVGIMTQKPDTRFNWTIDNCTFDGVALTAENIKSFPYTSYAGIDSDIWTTQNLKVNGTTVE